MAELDRCIAFMRAFDERRAQRIVLFRFGKAYVNDSLPRARQLNAVLVDVLDAIVVDELVENVDRLQADLDFRLIWVDKEALGRRLEPELVARGWATTRNLVMTHVRPGRPADTSGVVEIDAATLVPVWAAGIERAPRADPELVRQLVEAQLLRQQAVHVRYFAVLQDGCPISYCELFSDGATGQIESVLTLEQHRGNGYASAVVTKALQASRALGHDLTFLTAEEDDWPKGLYAKLGFEAVGRVWDFTRDDV